MQSEICLIYILRLIKRQVTKKKHSQLRHELYSHGNVSSSGNWLTVLTRNKEILILTIKISIHETHYNNNNMWWCVEICQGTKGAHWFKVKDIPTSFAKD